MNNETESQIKEYIQARKFTSSFGFLFNFAQTLLLLLILIKLWYARRVRRGVGWDIYDICTCSYTEQATG